jgi:Protein of unknown function (DUF2939)
VKQRSWILVGVAAAAVIGVFGYALSPFLAFNNLRDAAKTGNRDRLEQVVDFPAVRENLKSQIAAGLMKSMSADPEMLNNPFAAIGALLAPAITDRMVDSIVTPDGIALMLGQGKVSKPGEEPRTESASAKDSSNLETTLSYRTRNRFRAELRRRDQPDTTLALTLERRGLFGWKLIRIDIPETVFNPTPSKAAKEMATTTPVVPAYRSQNLAAAEIVDFNWHKDPNFGTGGAIMWNVQVRNKSSTNIESLKVEFTTYDAAGKVIASAFTYISAIPPGQTRADESYADLYNTENNAKAIISEVNLAN